MSSVTARDALVRNGGWGLAELMVALAVGAIASLFAGGLLAAANGGLAGQAEAAELDDTGRYVLATVGRAVRQAGAGLDTTTGLEASGPELRMAFTGAPDGSVVNCAGSAEKGAVGWSVFVLEGDALRCRYRAASSWSAQTMAHGVEDFDVRFGADTDPAPDGIANRWLRAEEVADWARVVALRLSFGLRGKHGKVRFSQTFRRENLP